MCTSTRAQRHLGCDGEVEMLKRGVALVRVVVEQQLGEVREPWAFRAVGKLERDQAELLSP